MCGTGASIMITLIASFLVKSAFAEEKVTAVGVSMAATLLGSISFVMCLYYFVNYDDKDIKQKAWETISSTISIFCAVLLFSSFNDLAEAYVIDPIFGEGDATKGALLVDMIHMIFWYTMMGLSLAFLSGAAGPWRVDMDEFEKMDAEEKEEL